MSVYGQGYGFLDTVSVTVEPRPGPHRRAAFPRGKVIADGQCRSVQHLARLGVLGREGLGVKQGDGLFGGIALILACMTTWELRSPSIPRRGLLPISTTRGDRLFIGLLGSAYLHLLVISVTDWSIWVASALSLVWLLSVMRWG